MEISVVSIGKITTNWINEGLSVFETRIPHYIKYNSVVIPDIRNTKGMTKDKIKDEEGKLILDQISPADLVVLLDERGRESTSRDFAEWIQKQMNSGRKKVVLVIGGPYGFSQAVYNRGNSLMALSKMTLTHEMAKLILTEQLYRAMTILKGEPYHHD